MNSGHHNSAEDDAAEPRKPFSLQSFSLRSLGRRGVMIVAPIAVAFGGVALFSTMMATAPKPEKKAEAVKPTAVQVATVELRPVKISVAVQGEVRSRVETRLAPQVSGRIVWVSPAFVEGGAFRQGETLVRLESADYELAVVRAQSQVAQAREALVREEAEAELARKDWEMLGQGAKASALTLREPQMAQASAALAAAQAQLRGAELDLARTRISAPFAGRVRARSANVGDVISPGATIADVFSTEAAEVRVPLTDDQLAHLGAPVGFTADTRRRGPVATIEANVGGRQGRWTGTLTRVDAAIDPRTRVVFGVIEVRDPFSPRLAAPLAPGLFVSATLEGSRQQDMLVTPRGALKKNEFVYVVRADDTIDIRRVTPVQTTAAEAVFQANLAAGERVVVSHLPSVRQGMAVTPVQRGAAAEAAVKVEQEPS